MDGLKTCTRCVMDTTDPEIQFDENGVCNHCHRYDYVIKHAVFSGEGGRQKLQKMVDVIRREGEKKQYDCIAGVSGGVDSTYVVYLLKQLGLRPLAVHLDNGWDSEQAVSNIHNALKKLNIDLYTHVIDWEEFKDIQLSFLKSSTSDSEIPSDHALNTLMHQMAEKFRVPYMFAGCNARTESHLPRAWSQGHSDWKYISSVHHQFGSKELKTFPRMDLWTSYRYFSTHMIIYILDYIDYIKKDAIPVLEQELGWKYYGGKHYESIYTRFYQGYILPRKFGYDKRKTHFSSLICAGEITREEALEELKKPTYPLDLQEEDRLYVIKKFGLTEIEFDQIMELSHKRFEDYSSYGKLFSTPIFQSYRLMRFLLFSLCGTYMVFR